MGTRIDRRATDDRTPARTPVPPLARGPVLAVAGVLGAVLLVTSGRYGFFGDELYFLGAGKHLSWGYADQPPLLPLMARGLETVFPDQPAGLRLPATVATAAGALVVALLAREMGGARRAQVLAASVYSTSTATLWTGHILATSTFDMVAWIVVTWLVVRWLRQRRDGVADDRPLWWAALVTGVALWVKYLIPLLWLAIALGVLAAGPRDLLRRPALLVGGLGALALAAPPLIWQALHGWPQLRLGAVISETNTLAGAVVPRLGIVPLILLMAGVGLGAVLLLVGLWVLLRDPRWRPFRAVGVAAVVVLVAVVAAAGRPYYAAGVFAPLWAAGACRLEVGGVRRWWTSWTAIGAGAAVAVVLALPVLPVDAVRSGDGLATNPGSLGWPRLAATVAGVVSQVPPEQRPRTVVIGENYWLGGALDHYAPYYGLPPVYSANRGYWYLGGPPESTRTAVVVTAFPDKLAASYRECRRAARFDNPRGVPLLNRDLSVWICRRPVAGSWSALWARLQTF